MSTPEELIEKTLSEEKEADDAHASVPQAEAEPEAEAVEFNANGVPIVKAVRS